MISRIVRFNPKRPPGPLFRAVIFALAGLLAMEPAVVFAQRSRKKPDQEKEQTTRKRRSPLEAFSRKSDAAAEDQAPTDQAVVDAESIGRAAYDAIIRSGLYIVGPGDVFSVVMVTDGEIDAQEVPVAAEGTLVIPFVGSVSVAGLTLAEAHRHIRSRIDRQVNFAIDVNLSRLKIFPVNVVGKVNAPGAYAVRGVEQVSEMIIRAGGLLDETGERASLRNIQILRLSESGAYAPSGRTADLLLWNSTGSIQYNPFLLDGDQIIVPARGDSISISGAVKNPGSYEFAPGDRLSDLISLGGGPLGSLDHVRAELLRLGGNGSSEQRIEVNLASAMIAGDAADLELQPGDKLHLEGTQNRVTVEGEVRFPGAYPITEGTTLKELIVRAGGFTEHASMAQASLIRETHFGNGQEEEEDVALTRLLNLPRAQLTDKEKAVVTMKTQRVPGRLPIDFDALFKHGREEHNILLKGGDIIRVPRFAPSVMVNGSVLAPAAIPYDAGYAIADYVARAGGFSDRAKKKDVIVIQGTTGNAIQASKIIQIAPGDAIYVPEKTAGQGWRIFRESLLVLTQVATLILIIQNTRN